MRSDAEADGGGEGPEHGDLRGARRAQVLLEHGEATGVEPGAGIGQHLARVGGGGGVRVDPLDDQCSGQRFVAGERAGRGGRPGRWSTA
ncbi:MAG: hypothetical protein U5K30_11510 [Acidimicrobiales bacterium]|nr:hypothetical protein [Acidimicrobiales bacterium]